MICVHELCDPFYSSFCDSLVVARPVYTEDHMTLNFYGLESVTT